MVLRKLREVLLPKLQRALSEEDMENITEAFDVVEGGFDDCGVILSNDREFCIARDGFLYFADPARVVRLSWDTIAYARRWGEQKLLDLLAEAETNHYTWFTLPTPQGVVLIHDGLIAGMVKG